MIRLVAIILTFNEERHLERCISSLKGVATEIVVADCFSTDRTTEIARSLNATVIQHEWVSHSNQFNWALTQIDPVIDWVIRIDADEIVSPELAGEIGHRLPAVAKNVSGIYLKRRIAFQGQLIRHGGLFPVKVLRLFRNGHGQCEKRWMDEHIKVDGRTEEFAGELIDDNLNSLTWWTEKHNKYASLEAIDMLNLEFGFMAKDSVANLKNGKQAEVKRWLKEQIYARLPLGVRAASYFCYRYFVRLGFLDGRTGLVFHGLQGLWYRFLVDAKIDEVKSHMARENVDVVAAIDRVLGIRLQS